MFTFIDLFAGIGGTRIAFERLGGKCIFASEKDPVACKIYEENFGMSPQRDITKIEPDHPDIGQPDILVAGFPCQAFSYAGKRLGFDDERGTMFHYIHQIMKAKMPKAFFLENVKGLLSHDGGRTIGTILSILRDDLGYYVPDPKVIDASDFGIPQKRERIFIVGFSPKTGIKKFSYPEPIVYNDETRPLLRDAIEEDPVPVKYYLSQGYLDCLKRHKVEQKRKGRGFGYDVLDPETDIANTLTVGGMGRERNLIVDHKIADRTPTTNIHSEINSEDIRKLTPRECARLMGFDDSFKLDAADTHLYRLLGNSVAIDAVEYTAAKIIEILNESNLL